MTYSVTIDPVAGATNLRGGEALRGVRDSESAPALAAADTMTDTIELRRLRRVAAYGPRCPDCTGPLVFGEGCHLCPVCGYSACGGRS